MIRTYAAIAVFGFSLIIDKHSEERVMNVFGNNVVETKSRVLELVPSGSAVAYAMQLMEESGFRCEVNKNVRFAEDDPSGGPQIIHGPSDTLWCDSLHRSGKFLMSKRYQITFTLDKKGLTSGVFVSISILGI